LLSCTSAFLFVVNKKTNSGQQGQRQKAQGVANVDVESNKLHRVKTNSTLFNYSKVETTIQNLVQQIKSIKYGKYDESMLVLTECLKLILSSLSNKYSRLVLILILIKFKELRLDITSV